MSRTSFFRKIASLSAVAAVAATFAGCVDSGSGSAQSGAAQPVGQSAAAAQPAQQQQARQSASQPVYDESLVRVQKVYGEGATVGQPYEFQIVVTAVKPTAGVTIRQALPESVEFYSSFPAAELDESGAPVWDLGALGQGEQRTLNLVVVPSRLGNYSFNTTVKAQPKAAEVVRVGEPVLRLSVQGPESVEVGEEVLWKVLVTNDGNAAARHVQIRSVLPSGFQVSGSASEQVSRLLPGQSAQLTVKAVPGEAGIFSAFFSAGYDVASGPAKVVQGNAQIQVRSSQVRMVVTGPATRYIFAPATYTLNVTNTGGTALENLTLVNDLPKGAVLYGKVSEGGEVFSRRSETSAPQLLEARTDAKTGVSGYWQQDGNPLRDDSAGQVQWAIASLEPGQSVSREVTYYSALPGSPENLARVVTSRGLSANSSFTTQWKAIPGLYTALVDDADPIKVGDKLTYTVTVGNQSHDGTILVRSLEVTVPSVLKVESAGEGGRVNGNVVTFQQVELAPQQKVELTITAIGEKLGTGIAVMKTTTNFHAEPIINEQSTSVY